MSDRFYREFIDGLVDISDSVSARRFNQGIWHPEPPPAQEKYNTLLSQLSPEQRTLIAEILQHERTGGIHDALAYIQGNEIRLSNPEGESFTESPFDTDLNFDYICRLNDDPWPT